MPDQQTVKKRLTVQRVDLGTENPDIDHIEAMFESAEIPFHDIGVSNWPEYGSDVSARFKIAWSAREIYLKFYIWEQHVRAHYVDDSASLPYEDSCVEFFLIPGEDDIYYNIEVNCVGAILFKGGAPEHRVRFNAETSSKIKRRSSLGDSPFEVRSGGFEWTITLAVPVDIFDLSPVKPLAGRTIAANFYKCGDRLPEPHYLSWSPIDWPKPNFHLPRFFGEIYFQ